MTICHTCSIVQVAGNSVAGGIPSGMSNFEALVKESMEEASIEGNVTCKMCMCYSLSLKLEA